MNRFIIVDGLPYLYDKEKAYAVRWDNEGFTVGAEVKITSAPTVTYSELSIKAQCADHLDSIGSGTPETAENELEKRVNLDDMTVKELREYASERNIDISKAVKKADVLGAIKAVQFE